MSVAVDHEIELQERMGEFVNDPYGFVMFAYPWGEKGTPLEHEDGPDKWQEKVLKDIGHGLEHGWIENSGKRIDCTTGIRIAAKSGHGIGKSCLMAWLDHWFISTRPNPAMVTTANTKEQLTSKTWREQAKWHNHLINKHWFKWTATRFICLADPATWFSSAIPQSENNSEAFAGTHEKYVMIKYDEASAVPDIIWEVTEGAMTDSGGVKIWITFGNPTQPTGRFAECWGKFRDMWVTYEIDSRDSKRTDKKLIQKWIDAYGEDSDFVRVRVKGQTPRAGIMQFIPTDIVEAAMGKKFHVSAWLDRAKVLGVDCARFGDDQFVLTKRQGPVAYGIKKFRGLNTQTLAGIVAEEINAWEPDQVFIDMGNIGAAVYDLLVDWGYKDIVTGVWFGSNADDDKLYFNKRVEMYGKARDWLEDGGAIPDDPELRDDLTAVQYGFTSREQFQLEKKEDMKKRGLASPDCGDSFVLTFAYPVVKRTKYSRNQGRAKTDYDMFNSEKRQPDKARAKTKYDMFGRR